MGYVIRDASVATAIGIPKPIESGRLWAFPCHSLKSMSDPVPVPLQDGLEEEELLAELIKYGLPDMGRIHNLLQRRGDERYQMTLVVGMSEQDAAGKLGQVLSSLENVQIMWDVPERIQGGFQRAGATGYVWPAAIAVQPPGRTTVFNEADTLDKENLNQFLQQVREGTYPLFVRSEDPTMQYQSENFVMPLANSNFDAKVRHSALPSIVLFYAQQTARKGNSLAAFDVMNRLDSYFDYNGHDVQLFTFNVELNEPPPEHDHEQLPQMILYIPSADGKTTIKTYNGKYALRAVAKWVDSFLEKPSRTRHDEL